MMIQPNNTPVLATIVSREDSEIKSRLGIVLLEVLEEGKLPAFLYTGRLLEAECLVGALTNDCKVGSIIHAIIEVTGNPFNQHFILTSIITMEDSEEE